MKILLVPFTSAFKVYSSWLQRKPLLTQSVTSGVLMSCGDALSQNLIEKRDVFDFTRTRDLFFIGSCFFGPILRGWYLTLSKTVTGSRKVAAFKMVLLDQTIMPPFFIGSFLTIFGFIRGQTTEEITERLKIDAPAMLMNNYKIWPAVQIVNFYFVPLNYRVLVVNTVALFWNTYVSFTANKSFRKEEVLDSQIAE